MPGSLEQLSQTGQQKMADLPLLVSEGHEIKYLTA